MIVVDASAALELLLAGPLSGPVAARLFGASEPLCAPQLLDVEVAQVLRRLVRRREVGNGRAEQAFEDLESLPMARYPHQPLLPRIWRLRDSATAFDACYLVLAEVLDATLVTCDKALASVPGARAKVTVLA